MPTVIHQLADAFLRRKEALAERNQAKTKLAGSDYFMPKSAKQDLSNKLSVFEQGGLPELLKQGASEMYHNPIVNTAISLTPGAGDVQSGYEAVQSAREGNWGEAGLNALGVLPFIPSMGMIGKTVWHGSPHSFEKFDLSKIGTGEGAQAYGHGLYLAESPGVATGYKEALSRYKDLPESGPVSAAGAMLDSGVPMERIKETMNKVYGSEGFFAKKFGDKNVDIEDAIQQAQAAIAKGKEGYLYQVDLPDEQIAKMLDWDKPLSEQPEILGKLRSYSEQNPNMNAMFRESLSPMESGATTGDAIYRTLSRSLDESKDLMKQRDALYAKYQTGNMSMSDAVRAMSPEDRTAFSEIAQRIDDQKNVAARTSGLLNELGIPGIKYLDQASRGAGEGTSNYVVFSDEIPKILERNGTSVFEFPKD